MLDIACFVCYSRTSPQSTLSLVPTALETPGCILATGRKRSTAFPGQCVKLNEHCIEEMQQVVIQKEGPGPIQAPCRRGESLPQRCSRRRCFQRRSSSLLPPPHHLWRKGASFLSRRSRNPACPRRYSMHQLRLPNDGLQCQLC